MLYYLFSYLDEMNFPGAGVFEFISFRAAMALVLSLVISIIFGKRVIGMLQKKQMGETVRDLLDLQVKWQNKEHLLWEDF